MGSCVHKAHHVADYSSHNAHLATPASAQKHVPEDDRDYEMPSEQEQANSFAANAPRVVSPDIHQHVPRLAEPPQPQEAAKKVGRAKVQQLSPMLLRLVAPHYVC